MSHRGPMKRHLSHCPWNDASIQGCLKLISIRIIIQLHSSAPSRFLHPSAFPSSPSIPASRHPPSPYDVAFCLHWHHTSLRPPCSTSPPSSRRQGSQSVQKPCSPPPSFLSHASSLCLLPCQDPSCEPVRWLFFRVVNISVGPRRRKHQHGRRVCPQQYYFSLKLWKEFRDPRYHSHHKNSSASLRSEKKKKKKKKILTHLSDAHSPPLSHAWCKFLLCESLWPVPPFFHPLYCPELLHAAQRLCAPARHD